jgi:hypothetical protein
LRSSRWALSQRETARRLCTAGYRFLIACDCPPDDHLWRGGWAPTGSFAAIELEPLDQDGHHPSGSSTETVRFLPPMKMG